MDSFSITLIRLRDTINSRLRPGIDKVWVQGVSASNARLVFTIFYRDMTQTPLNCGYVMRFLEVKNFRHYRPDGDIENEERLLENYITHFRRVLDDIIE
jgi:hypothetical protein